MKRVRHFHQDSCQKILASRLPEIEKWNPDSSRSTIEQFNEWVQILHEQNGSAWCEQRALTPFPTNDFLFSVVMPVFNERETILDMIERVCKVDLPMELIIVNDGSGDGTTQRLEEWSKSEKAGLGNRFGDVKLQVIHHSENEGKGAALKTGFLAAQGDVVAIQDADQEYDPQEFPVLLSTLLSDEADVVYGSRFAGGNRTNSPRWHRFGNGLITWFSNLMTGLNVTDAETCYKLMRKSALDEIVDGLQEKRFGIELEMTAKLAKNRSLRFDERVISYHKRTYAEGKKIGIRDGFRALWCILKY